MAEQASALKWSLDIHRLSSRLQTTLRDIVEHVQFDSNFRITHPDYAPLELPPEVLQRLQPLPFEVKQQYLSIQLRNFLHGTYWKGNHQSFSHDSISQGSGENDAVNPTNLPFYKKLHSGNCGSGYFDDGWTVLGEANNGVIAVQKQNLTLYIHRHQHLRSPNQAISVGESIEICLPPNRVEAGLYIAIGNAGLAYLSSEQHPQLLVHLYCNLPCDGIVAVMQDLTQQLNDMHIPFLFRAPYLESDYDRYDTGILTIPKCNYITIQKMLLAVYTKHQIHFQPNIPLCTKELASGLALAEESNHQFKLSSQDTFGVRLCQILANGLMESSERDVDSPSTRLNYIVKHCTNAEIDLTKPHLQAGSTDIFLPLNEI
jgi:hypothetical protein